MSDEENNTKIEAIKTEEINGTVRITEVTTSQTESRQKAQYENNAYFTSMKLDFVGGLDITKIEDLKKMVLSVQTANALCASNNRKCQVRDGIKPSIGTTATAQINQVGSDELVKKESIVDPSKLTGYIQNNLGQLTKVMQQIGVESQLGAELPVNETEAPVAEATPAKRTNPKRSKKAAPVASDEPMPAPIEEDVVS